MKALNASHFALVALFAVTLYSCQTEELKLKSSVLELPATPFSYQMGAKDELPTLGRVLFYDSRLSINSSVSCSSCHNQSRAFADGKKFSRGFENKLTGRNSMPIQNIVADISFGKVDSTGFGGGPKPGGGIIEPGGGIINDPGFPFFQPTALFWDGRQHSIQTMVMEPIKNHIEMGTSNFDQLAVKLAQIQDYQNLFANAFTDGLVTPEHIANALSAFLVSIKSNQSKFDLSLRGDMALNGLEQEGKNLFFDKYDCNSCHQLQTPFNGYQLAGGGGFADIGLDKTPGDPGLFRVSGSQQDLGKFKIPSLRNIALTAPYMHDGRLETLEDVLDHYSEGISESENLDSRLRGSGGAAKQFNIPASDKKAIIAFLHTLTDHQMITDPKFSNPFKLK